MPEPDFTGGALRRMRVLIWGLGLMGGSLALALRGRCAGLAGIDQYPETAAQALERGIVDVAHAFSGSADARICAALADADMIVLATPARTIVTILQMLPGLSRSPKFVIDLGSTKVDILAAMENLPESWEAVGGHPMCGREKSSLEHADAQLYRGAVFALAANARTSERARVLAEELAAAVGARPAWVEAESHDRWVAATSHLPFLMASALAGSTPVEAALLVGTGFQGAARLAASNSEMMVDILATNRENVRSALGRFRAEIDRYDALLAAGDFTHLAAQFQRAAERLRQLEDRGD